MPKDEYIDYKEVERSLPPPPSIAYKRSFSFDVPDKLGKGRFLKERGLERAFELKRYEDELASAEEAQEADWYEQDLYSLIFGGAGAIGGGVGGFLATGGNPWGALKGATAGWTAGSEAGKWGQHFTSDYDPKDYALSLDPGKHDVSERYKWEDVSKGFERADESRMWENVAQSGKNLTSLWMMYSGGPSFAELDTGKTASDIFGFADV